jgi:hypothetical protein
MDVFQLDSFDLLHGRSLKKNVLAVRRRPFSAAKTVIAGARPAVDWVPFGSTGPAVEGSMGAVLWTGVLGATIAARLHPPFAGEARWIALGGAFWMATHGYLRRGGEAQSGLRFVAGLALAAGASQIGWVLLHLDRVPADPRALLDLATGQSVLFAPLGLLAVAPWSRAARERYLAAALGSLPRAFAVARLGCLAAGCCHGVTGIHGTHPTRLYEIVFLLALDAGTRRLPSAWVGPATLVGFGGVRLLTEPVRAVPPLGEPLVAPSAVGLGWVAIGVAMALAAARRPRKLAGAA